MWLQRVAARSTLDGFWWPLIQQPRSKLEKINKHEGARRELDKSSRSELISVRENSVKAEMKSSALSVISPHTSVLKLDPCLSNFSRLQFSSAGSPPSHPGLVGWVAPEEPLALLIVAGYPT